MRSQSPQKFGKYFWGRFFPACETNFLRGGQILNNKGSHNSIFRQILCYLLVEKERKPKKMIEIQQQITKEKQKEKKQKRTKYKSMKSKQDKIIINITVSELNIP